MRQFLLFAIISISLATQAQEEKKSKIRYLAFDYGIMTHPNSWGWEEFSKVKPKSEILSSSWYDSLTNADYSFNARMMRTANFQFQAGFNLPRNEDARIFTNPKLMLGVKFYALRTQFGKGSNVISTLDTLTSSQTGQQFFVEKQRIKAAHFDNEQKVAQLNISYQTNLLKQTSNINPYLGFGIGGGVVYQNTSRIYYKDSETTINMNYNYFPLDTIYAYKQEKINTNDNFILSSEIKGGIDFHLDKFPAIKVFAEY